MRRAEDPVGPENDAVLLQGLDWADRVICAWGTHGEHLGRGPEVAALLKGTGRELLHLGLSKAGHPKHPLYIGYKVQPQVWEA